MSAIRRVAERVLLFVVRRLPEGSRSWGRAMLREMDFVDNDWAALRWALGSTAALCKQSLIQTLKSWREGAAPNASSHVRRGRWIPSVVSGVAAAVVVLAISVLTLATLVRVSWLGPHQGTLAEPFFVVVIPDALCLLSAIALWRPQGRMASGMLAAGATLVAHSIIYFVA